MTGQISPVPRRVIDGIFRVDVVVYFEFCGHVFLDVRDSTLEANAWVC